MLPVMSGPESSGAGVDEWVAVGVDAALGVGVDRRATPAATATATMTPRRTMTATGAGNRRASRGDAAAWSTRAASQADRVSPSSRRER